MCHNTFTSLFDFKETLGTMPKLPLPRIGRYDDCPPPSQYADQRGVPADNCPGPGGDLRRGLPGDAGDDGLRRRGPAAMVLRPARDGGGGIHTAADRALSKIL